MKLGKKIGIVLLYSTLIVSLLIGYSYLFIINKLQNLSLEVVINYKVIFVFIIIMVLVINIIIFLFINEKIIKRINKTEKVIDEIVNISDENIIDKDNSAIDEIASLDNGISIVVDKLVNTESSLEEEEQNYSIVLNAMSNAFFYFKAIENDNGEYIDGIVLNLNYAAVDFLDMKKEDLLKCKLSQIKNIKDNGSWLLDALKDIDKTKSVCIQEPVNIIEDKWGLVSVYSFKKGYFSIIINDITEIRNYAEEMAYLANYDTLTNLLNRHNLFEYLIELESRNEEFSIYFIDLDEFKNINDVLGHNTGDEILRIVADRLLELTYDNENITVGRLGGDEFLVVKRGKNNKEEIKELAFDLLNVLNKKVEFSKYDFTIKVSIGISSYPYDAEDVFTLIKYADIAMYEGKEKGGNTFKLFSEEMVEDLNLQSKLSKAMDNNEFKVYFQPIYDVFKKRIVGAEALTRWITPEEIVSPLKYIPLAKKSGDIIRLDEIVLRKSCECCKKMHKLGEEEFIASINISYVAIKQMDFIDKLLNIVEEEGVSPSCIKLEITEDEFIDNIEFVSNILNKLKTAGFKIALDDFGIGYSSFNYIKSLPLDTIKIDRSLITSIERDNKTLTIIETLIKLSHILDLDVVCEGVEIENQVDLLKGVSCDKIQGYYISKPIDYDNFIKFVKEYNKIPS